MGVHRLLLLLLLLPVLLLPFMSTALGQRHKQPNIVLMIADDLGFNDVGFRGSNQIPTPNIDALAFSGLVLDRHYVLPTCTPSRTALLTGIYPIRTGMQGYPLKAGEPRGLPLEYTTLPQRLADLGYRTTLVGKWHQGAFRSEYTPTRRGFHHHLGYWNGYMSYFDHDNTLDINDGIEKNRRGLDLHWDMELAPQFRGTYATHVFSQRAEDVIKEHDVEAGPMFLQIAHLATHVGLNGSVLEVPDLADTNRRFSYIQDEQRRRLAGIIREMDLSVGRVIDALQQRGMLDNTVIVFMADNGGETLGKHRNYASNWPLRGQKWTLYEGGVRGAAVMWSPLLARPGTIHTDLMHATDWLPTFFEAGGGDVAELGPIDGVSQWKALTTPSETRARSEVLVQIDGGGAIIQDNWKLIRGELYPELSVHLGESGRERGVPAYDVQAVLDSAAARALAAVTGRNLTAAAVRSTRMQTNIRGSCRTAGRPTTPSGALQDLDATCDPYCLFDIMADPCEARDVAAENPLLGDKLLDRLRDWEALTVPLANQPVDEEADPLKHNRTWVPWLDDDHEVGAVGSGAAAAAAAALSCLFEHATLIALLIAVLSVSAQRAC